MAALSILNDKTKYVNWIKQEFQPRTLAIPDASIEQLVDNAVRYWNTHSAYKISQMVTYSTGQIRAQLSPAFKSVAFIYPNKNANFIWNEFPTWSLAGISVLDNIRTDLVMATEAFRTFNIYAGANFRWWVEENHDDPTQGGWLYCKNVPSGTTGLYVIGTRRILPTDVIDSQHINDWLNRYSKALVKQAEGHALRAAGLVLPGDVDGQQLYNEGKEEMKELQDDLQKSARWVVFLKRQ